MGCTRNNAPSWMTAQVTAVSFLELLHDTQLGASAPRICSLLLRPCAQQQNPLSLPSECVPVPHNPVLTRCHLLLRWYHVLRGTNSCKKEILRETTTQKDSRGMGDM